MYCNINPSATPENKHKPHHIGRLVGLYISFILVLFLFCLAFFFMRSFSLGKKSREAQIRAMIWEQVALWEQSLLHNTAFAANPSEYADAFSMVWLDFSDQGVIYASFALDEQTKYIQNRWRLHFRKNISSLQQAEMDKQIAYCYELSPHIRAYFVLPPPSIDVKNILFLTIPALILIFLSLLIYDRFKKKVYLPILQIEKSIDSAMQDDIYLQLNLPPDNQLFPLSQKLNAMFQRMRESLIREYNLQILRKASEINALQSQINPHFLYNTLDSIRGQALAQGAFEIAQLLKSISNIFRYSISHKSSIVSLKDELNHVDNYLAIQQYRFNNKFNIEKKFLDDESLLLACKVPKLILQPIVENSVFHGLETKKGRGSITLSVYNTQKRLIIEIEDNGLGIESDLLNKLNQSMNEDDSFNDVVSEKTDGSSIALKNVSQRIRMMYGDLYGVRIYSTVGVGTTVQIVLPFCT